MRGNFTRTVARRARRAHARKKTPELTFQQHIAEFFIRVHRYGVLEQAEITDTDHCIAEDHLWAFLNATQADTLKKLQDDYGTDARDEVFRALRKELDRTPLWLILRRGLTVRGQVAKMVDEKGFDLRPEDLAQLRGVGVAKASSILAAIEYARRRIKPEGTKVTSPADLLPHVRHYADRKQEHLLCASINGANEIICIRVVSVGLVDRSPVHPREVFADALADRASGVLVAHNHPSGSLEPSSWDLEVTRQLNAAGDILGVPLMDHIIFNRAGYLSLLEAGMLKVG